MERIRTRLYQMKGMKWSGSVALAIIVAMVLCLDLGGSEVLAKEKIWKLKIQAFTVPGKLDCQWVVPLKFTELVKKHTKGQVDMTFHPVGELVGPREIWTAASAGTIDGGTTLDIYEGGTHPELCFDVGAIWSIDEFFKVMHAGSLDILNKHIQKENIRIIGYFPLMNYYAVSMKREHVKVLEDMKGKKIRGMGGAANLFLKDVGAGIVTLPMSEVPSALQTGVVEGIHTGMAGLYAMHLWEVAPYFTSTRSGNFGFFFILNDTIYQKFPQDVKAGIDSAQLELEKWYRDWDGQFWKEIRSDVEKKGIRWHDLPPNESERWRKLLTKASATWVMERTPDLGKRLFKIVENATGRKVLE
jgi:TRAP-type C4-dicarboxylate transport system substrate-binding protein